MPVEIYTNEASTTVSSGAQLSPAPSQGATETWVVTSSAGWPSASNTASPPTQFHVADPAAPGEIIAVTNVSGTSWSVTRGAESSTPAVHSAGFTVQQVITAGGLGSVLASANNLSDLGSASAARASLGLGPAATATIDTTATDIQPSGTQSAGGTVTTKVAYADHVHPLHAGFAAADAGFLEWAYDPLLISVSTQLATSGNVYLTRINLRVARSISNVTVYLGTLGNTLTTGQCFAGLYAGTTAGSYTAGQLIGTSADQTTIWNTGGTVGVQTIALTGAPFTVPAGFVWAALMFHGTTGPSFGRAFSVTAASSNIGFTATGARFASATGATTLPSSITVANNSLQAPEYWAALS